MVGLRAYARYYVPIIYRLVNYDLFFYADCVNLVIELLEVSIHQLLWARNLYPKEVFRQFQKFNVLVHVRSTTFSFMLLKIYIYVIFFSFSYRNPSIQVYSHYRLCIYFLFLYWLPSNIDLNFQRSTVTFQTFWKPQQFSWMKTILKN